MGTKNKKGPSKRSASAGASGVRTSKRRNFDKNRGESDDSTDKTTLDDSQRRDTPQDVNNDV